MITSIKSRCVVGEELLEETFLAGDKRGGTGEEQYYYVWECLIGVLVTECIAPLTIVLHTRPVCQL